MSGLIFVALALVWAVALLPKALRHHDEVAQTRSVDRVSDHMRVLARREAVSEREARLVRTPPTVPAQRTASPVPAQRTPPPSEVRPVRPPMTRDRLKVRVAAQRKAAAAAARRRRLILGVLVVVDLGVGVAAGLGQLPIWTPAVPLALTLVFLVTARVTVRRAHRRWDAELAELKALAAAAAPKVVEMPEPAPVVEGPEAQVAPEQSSQGHTVISGLDDTSSFPVGLLDDVTPTTDAGSLWDPLPVTLPTYVSKPRASRSVRTIDLQAPGVASSGHDAASSALVADAATSPPPDDLPQQAVGS